MKAIKFFFYFLFIVFTFSTCQKQPIADFTSANYIYHAGETIHLKNTSLDAYSWKWTAPNGKTYDTKDLDYVTDINDTGGTLKFTLEVSSKKGNKNTSVTKSILLKQAILPSDYYSVNSTVYKPTDKKSYININSNNWLITATSNATTLYFQFYGTSPPAAGTYSLVPYSPNPGEATVAIQDIINYYSYSGQLTVIIPSAGRVRAVFNNADDGSGNLLSGDITVH